MKKFDVSQYDIEYVSQGKDAGDSMPLGGHSVGCNVWCEKDAIYLYMAQSGALDEAGNMLKMGRLKLELSPCPFVDGFSQKLRLKSGDILITGKNDDVTTEILLWVDVFCGGIHIEINSEIEHEIVVQYDNWRSSDVVSTNNDTIEFYHKNKGEDYFWDHIHQEELEDIASEFANVQHGLVFGGRLVAEGMCDAGVSKGKYCELDCARHSLINKTKAQSILVCPHISHSGSVEIWQKELEEKLEKSLDSEKLRKKTPQWWEDFWQRSYIEIGDENSGPEDVAWQVGRNYQLFRYMLGCNAYGEYPTKFNGGLFTIDPQIWGTAFDVKTPDERDWGGIVFTAQNQRLLYWPMLRAGDYDMMKPQFDFYLRMLHGAKARAKHFFGVENAVCIPEQTDANGMSAYYGLYGLDYPLHVRYHYVTAVEFGYMMLNYIEQTGEQDVEQYIDFISAVLNFYNQKYSSCDQDGKRIIFPSTAIETYHKADNIYIWGEEGRHAANYNENEVAVTNPTDIIYALRAILKKLKKLGLGTDSEKKKWQKLYEELPPITTEIKHGKKVIAPCKDTDYKRCNCELPQLYACYPYQEIGIGRDNNADLSLARDTYFYAPDGEDQLANPSWQHIGVFAARLGLVEEAKKYQFDKLKDSGRRFPAFWGPGHDYTPDHNHGGCGMIGLQEMLLQTIGDEICLLPAWDKSIDVHFKLWIDKKTAVEVECRGGQMNYRKLSVTEG